MCVCGGGGGGGVGVVWCGVVWSGVECVCMVWCVCEGGHGVGVGVWGGGGGQPRYIHMCDEKDGHTHETDTQADIQRVLTSKTECCLAEHSKYFHSPHSTPEERERKNKLTEYKQVFNARHQCILNSCLG